MVNTTRGMLSMCRMISVLVVLTAVAVAGYRLQQPFAANTPTTSSNQQLSLAARGRQSNTLLLHRLISKPSSVSSSSSRSMSTAVQSDNNHNKRTVEITVASDVTPKTTRLDVYLSTADSATYSRSFIGQLCDAGLVFVNEQVKGKSYKVCPQDVIRFEMEEKTTLASQVAPENIPLDIIYEDADIIAVSKANGMVVHPAPGTPNGTFVNALLHHIGQSAGQVLIEHGQQRQSQYLAGIDVDDDTTVTAVDSGMKIEESEDVDDDFDDYEDDNYVEALDAKFEETPQLPPHVNPLDLPETPEAANASPPFLRPGIVHRLDKGTTGVLLAGKHPKAVEKLSNIFAKRLIRKVYLAICIGYPGDTTIVESIGRSVKNRQVMCVYDGPPGKPAITHTKTIAFDGKLSVCLVRIETGRTHQIRVHLQNRRTPILGDETYGNKEWNKRYQKSHKIFRPLLHAYETEFIHPFTNKKVILKAPLPQDIQEIVDKISSNMIYATSEDMHVHVTPSSAEEMTPLYDTKTKLLVGSTEVIGKPTRAIASSGGLVGGTPIHSAANVRRQNSPGGYVPLDRLKLEEDDWTKMELSEDPAFFQ